MQEELAALEELQKLDLDILELRNELNSVPLAIEETRQNVSHIGEILERERERLRESEEWRQDREKAVELQSDLLNKSKAKLQVARNEKENKAAQREIDIIRKNIQEREKETLDVMEAIEQYRKAIEEHTVEFAELEKHLNATEEEGNERMKEMGLAIGKTEDRRAQLVSRVPDKLLRQYERIHKRLGLALVPVVDGSCTGCNIGLQPQMYNLLQRGNKIFTCPNCFRILVYNKVDNPESGPEGQD